MSGRYPQRKPRSREQDPIRVLPPVLVEMTEEQLEEASDLLAELMIRYMRRRLTKVAERGGSREQEGV